MQGVFTKFLQLWIPNKTDKGSVVTDVFEPNFIKLDQNAETTNQTLTNLSNNKLDTSIFTGSESTENIQSPGTKTKGSIYWDNSVTPKVPYLCVKTTEDITPTSNFITADNKNLAKDVYEETFRIEIGNPVQHELTFRKIGKIIVVFCITRGGSINGVFSGYTLPENFRPSVNSYFTYPCVSGTPYIKIAPDGSTVSHDNDATMHTLQSTTSYFITQVYISVNNI